MSFGYDLVPFYIAQPPAIYNTIETVRIITYLRCKKGVIKSRTSKVDNTMTKKKRQKDKQ